MKTVGVAVIASEKLAVIVTVLVGDKVVDIILSAALSVRVTNVAMIKISGTNSYTYNWNTSTPTLAAGAYSVTVSGTDTNGNAYAGTDSITFTISPTFYLDANGVTVKCRGCSAGDQGVVNGVIYTAVDNSTIGSTAAGDWDTIVTSLVTDMSNLSFPSKGTFIEDISSWDTSNVTDMSRMFQGALKFNQYLCQTYYF